MGKDEIIKIIKENNITSYQISQDTGLSQPGLDKIIDGVTVSPQRKTLKILAEYLQKRIGVKYESDIKVIHVEEPHEVIALENNNSNSFVKMENGQFLMTMPLAEFDIQAGLLDSYQDIDFLKDLKKHSIIVDGPVKGRYIAFRVKGDSMDDGTSNAILQNSIVATRELQRHLWTSPIRIKDFQYWVIYTSQSRYPLLKEIISHDVANGVIRCHSLNDAPEYQDFDLPLDDVQALFYVINVQRDFAKRSYY